ncbi:MAG TPA: prepilin peptidase [Planctomycetota bacterium]|nr:prepilin peptidase [Planctomycetota bacterium]
MIPIPAAFYLISLGLFGAIIGSYINMASYRLPRNISTVTRTRSFCPSCDHQLYWYDNLPILSYLSLLGRCRYCKKGIPIRYLLVEIFVAGLYVAAAYQFFVLNAPLMWAGPFSGSMPFILLAVQLFLIADLVLLSVIDLETWLIPIETTIWWIPIALILSIAFPELHGSATSWTKIPRLDSFIDSFTGLVLGAGMPWAIGFVTTVFTFFLYRFRGTNDRPLMGMGEGDGHLLGMFGAMLGWKPVMVTLMLGIFIGCVTGIAKILWDNAQQKRLGDKWKPWQPTFTLPEDQQKFEPPPFWPLMVMGIIVLIAVVVLYDQGTKTFSGLERPTMEELSIPLPPPQRFVPVDFRLIPIYLMAFIAALLMFASLFLNYLKSIDMLPQGSIKENEKGQKEEVMETGGLVHYVPFGPSLALAAIIVVFYDPLLRNLLYWWFVLGGTGTVPVLPWRVIGW